MTDVTTQHSLAPLVQHQNAAAMTGRVVPMPDEQDRLPFQALDRLSHSATMLDALVSTMIGRLQPYCHDGSMIASVSEQTLAPEESTSGLERRIQREQDIIDATYRALQDLNDRLRL